MASKAIVINEQDNVATLIGEAEAGQEIALTGAGAGGTIKVAGSVPYGHKVALGAIGEGEQVTKYGHSIGAATANIGPGEHVHIHNMESNRGRGDLAAGPA